MTANTGFIHPYIDPITARHRLQREGITVLVGCYDEALQLAAHAVHVPYLITCESRDVRRMRGTYSLFPEEVALREAVLALVDELKQWNEKKVVKEKKIAVLYDSEEGV